MPSRRRFLSRFVLAVSAGALAGCSFLENSGVAVVLVNEAPGTNAVAATVADPASEDFEASADLPSGSRRVFQNALPYGDARTGLMTARAAGQRVEREVPIDRAVAALVAKLDRTGTLAITVEPAD